LDLDSYLTCSPEKGSNYNVSLEGQKGPRPEQIINKLKEAAIQIAQGISMVQPQH